MAKVFSEAVNVRKHRVMFDHKELERLVAKAAADSIECNKPRIDRYGVTYKVTFEEATEGSPAYRVGTKAIVTIEEDLSPCDVVDTNES